MKHLSNRLMFIGLVVLAFAAIIATNRGQANESDREVPSPNWKLVVASVAQPETIQGKVQASLPPPEQNPCLHCHIEGEIVNEWMPISRWFVFGAMVLIFSFGVTRNLIVWKTRELWHHHWMYQFEKISAFFLILQAITGIILVVFYPSSPESFLQYISVIKAIHWGSAIVLFITTLALSLAGYLLPWYQRAFWALIFISETISGSLAIANLSFAYLYADWHIPPSPSRLYAFHTLLIPIGIAGLMSIYIIIQRKRGENQ
jgi:hypothetical protein